MLKEALIEEKIQTIAGMEFHEGKLDGMNVVVVKCSVGKVNAAACFFRRRKDGKRAFPIFRLSSPMIP